MPPTGSTATQTQPQSVQPGGLFDFIANGPKQGQRSGIGGFFDVIENATQSPLFGLGVGLLSGDPQQGFRNAQSLAGGQNSLLQNDDILESVVKLVMSGALEGMTREQAAARIRQLQTTS